jgi:hypothetical protein
MLESSYMKKAIVTGFLVLIIPFNSYAFTSKDVGIEFLSPLVQTIIGLLQDRITDLTAQIAVFKSTQPVCVSNNTEPIGSQTPTTPQVSPAPTTIIVQPPEPPYVQIVSVSAVYRTDAPYVMVGKTQDVCPTLTFTSDKPFFIQKFVFTKSGSLPTFSANRIVDTGDRFVSERNDISSKIKTERICSNGIADFLGNSTLLGSESLVYGFDGKQIILPDVTFTY